VNDLHGATPGYSLGPPAFSSDWAPSCLCKTDHKSTRPRTTQEGGTCYLRPQCPLWVISGHFATQSRCPLYPRTRTFGGASGRTFRPHDVEQTVKLRTAGISQRSIPRRGPQQLSLLRAVPSFASGGLARHVQLVANLLIGRFGKCSWLCGRGPRPSASNGGRRSPILFPTHLRFQARHQSLGILQIRRFEPFAELIVN